MSAQFGATYAAHYDEIYRGKQYAGECDLVEELFRREAAAPVHTVLDLGCGTGSHTVELARRGYRVTGVDRSPAMLAEARRKAAGLAAASLPRFVEADLRGFRAGERFDAVLMMFAVLGYQVTDDDLADALATVAAHLAPSGLFAADLWYGPAVEAIGPSARASVVRREEGGELRRVVSGSLVPGRRVCRVAIELELDRGGARELVEREVHEMRYFDRAELAARLAAAGLELRRLAAFPTLDREPDESTWNVLAVARAAL